MDVKPETWRPWFATNRIPKKKRPRQPRPSIAKVVVREREIRPKPPRSAVTVSLNDELRPLLEGWVAYRKALGDPDVTPGKALAEAFLVYAERTGMEAKLKAWRSSARRSG